MSVPGKNIHNDPWSKCSTCHRNPPALIDKETPRPWAVWPLTSHNDVCGEFAVEVEP